MEACGHWKKSLDAQSVIATSDDSTKRLPPLMQVTVIDPREEFSTSPRELETLAIDPLFPGQKKTQSIHDSSNQTSFQKVILVKYREWTRPSPSPKLGLILGVVFSDSR